MHHRENRRSPAAASRLHSFEPLASTRTLVYRRYFMDVETGYLYRVLSLLSLYHTVSIQILFRGDTGYTGSSLV